VLCAAPGEVSGLRVSRLTSTAAELTWNALPCREHNGIAVGYMYELRRQLQPSGPSSVNVMFGIINDTALDLNGLIPFSNYTFTVRFANHVHQGRRSSQDFVTFEDCEYLVSSAEFIVGFSPIYCTKNLC